jgi:hypothetical protein
MNSFRQELQNLTEDSKIGNVKWQRSLAKMIIDKLDTDETRNAFRNLAACSDETHESIHISIKVEHFILTVYIKLVTAGILYELNIRQKGRLTALFYETVRDKCINYFQKNLKLVARIQHENNKFPLNLQLLWGVND